MPAVEFDFSRVFVLVVAPPAITGPLEGFAPGSPIRVQRANDTFRIVRGIRRVTRVRSVHRDGSITLQLEAGSLHNLALSALAISDEKLGTGIGAVTVRDANSYATLAFTPFAWLRRIPSLELGEAPTPVTWLFDCQHLHLAHGALRQIDGDDDPPGYDPADFAGG